MSSLFRVMRVRTTGLCGVYFSLVVKTSCSMKDHFTFMLAVGLQGDNPDPDGDVSCNRAALLLLINSILHTCILYYMFLHAAKKQKKIMYLTRLLVLISSLN